MLGLPAHYCLFDFNLSVAFPLDIPIEKCRLDSEESWVGWPWYTPFDTSHGELDYDPFLFDVGLMGNMLKEYLTVRSLIFKLHPFIVLI